jgi:hypothetical protein
VPRQRWPAAARRAADTSEDRAREAAVALLKAGPAKGPDAVIWLTDVPLRSRDRRLAARKEAAALQERVAGLIG